MKQTRSVILRIFSLYKMHVAVMLPLLIITVIGLFIDRIPYLNLYKEIVILAILSIDWLAILWLSRISSRTMMLVALFLFAVTLPLHYLNGDWYVDILANFVYVILSIALFIEIRSLGVPRHEEKKRS